MISAKVIADSMNKHDERITTLQLVYPRFIHAEFLTHRKFSRNSSSSRAIPVKKVLEMVRNDPAMPIHWGKNQPGMQAHEELNEVDKYKAQVMWREAAIKASEIAERMMELGLHKQVANRILEPFQHMNTVLTATDFDNWDELRDHPDADPNICELAKVIKVARAESEPRLLYQGEWHLPYVTEDERANYSDKVGLLCMISSARCCRVSYLKHDGTSPNIQDDIDLCEKLAGSRPIHASPFEHVATPYAPILHKPEDQRNFTGWTQYRSLIEQNM